MLLVILGHGHRKGKAEPLYTKLTLVTHQPQGPEAQSCFLRHRERAHPASSGLRGVFHDTDHLEEDVCITGLIGCIGNHASNLALVTFSNQIYKCRPCHCHRMMRESHHMIMSWQQSWHKRCLRGVLLIFIKFLKAKVNNQVSKTSPSYHIAAPQIPFICIF